MFVASITKYVDLVCTPLLGLVGSQGTCSSKAQKKALTYANTILSDIEKNIFRSEALHTSVSSSYACLYFDLIILFWQNEFIVKTFYHQGIKFVLWFVYYICCFVKSIPLSRCPLSPSLSLSLSRSHSSRFHI